MVLAAEYNGFCEINKYIPVYCEWFLAWYIPPEYGLCQAKTYRCEVTVILQVHLVGTLNELIDYKCMA